MAYCATVIYVKIHCLTSPRGKPLDGATGRFVRYHKDLGGIIGHHRYSVSVRQEEYKVKVENLYAVNSRWLEEVRKSPMRGRMEDMMMEFRALGEYPCPITDLMVTDDDGKPSARLDQTVSWWGSHVFRYIRKRMETHRGRRGNLNWEIYHAIEQNQLLIAGHW